MILIGYSFGADILPFAYNRAAPDAERAHVHRLSLLGLSGSADFVIHVAGWLGVDSERRHPADRPELRPAAARAGAVLLRRDDADSAASCPS